MLSGSENQGSVRFGGLLRPSVWRKKSTVAAELPFRAEIFSLSQLGQHAIGVAQRHLAFAGPGTKSGPNPLLSRLASNEAVLEEAYELVNEAVGRGLRITPAAEWFIDNYHLIEEQVRTARRHLPRGYSRELPQFASGPSIGTPLVYDIALELIAHVDGRIDAENLRAFITAYQSVRPLKIGELWAIPIMLRIALIENLRRVASSVMSGRHDRDLASQWAERLIETSLKEPANLVVVLAEMVREDPPLTNAFVAEFAKRLHAQGQAVGFALTWLEQRLGEHGQTVDQIFHRTGQIQAADQVSIGNSIGSLRFLVAADWRDFVEGVSVVEATLRADPAGVYPLMDFGTRDRYRHVIEAIAKRSALSEQAIAMKAVSAAQAHATPSDGDGALDRRSHVGYFLVDRGLESLRRSAAMRLDILGGIRKQIAAVALPVYLGSILTITIGAASLIVALVGREAPLSGPLIAAGLLLAVSASQFAVALVNWVVTLTVPPKTLPRLDFSRGVPESSRTLVVVPTILTDPAAIDEMIEDLEIRYLANRDDSICFALLTDFRDAPQETMPEDRALIDHAVQAIDALNAKYARPQATGRSTPGFYLFHRGRKWNASEGAWMGWERKRGKLEELNATLRGRTGAFAVVAGPVDRLGRIAYVITLDTDTELPRDSAHQLIGTLAHPLNRPRFDAKSGRIVEGYGVLQPRVAVGMPAANRSLFVKMFGGEPGIDPYTRAVSDVYQDLFGEGSFVGKGIYDIDGFERAVGNRLPQNRILSHDLLEGAYARAGLVSDVTLFEDYPAAYPVDVSRRYRWIRGDWQIAAWLFGRIPGPEGRREHNPISALSRWKVFDNLRRSLVPIAMVGSLLLGWQLPRLASMFTLAVVAIYLLPSLLNVASQLMRRPTDVAPNQHRGVIIRSFSQQLLRELFGVACLPYDAWISAEAIGRTLFRVFVTRKRLLEWRTASEARQTTAQDLGGFYAAMGVQPLLAVGVGLSLGLTRQPALLVALPFLVAWASAPAIAWAISRPILKPRPKLSAGDVLFLRKLARRTWRFFEAFVTSADNFLPPDNFQEDPPRGVAHRTSPTNIGLSILANLTAYDFGYVTAGAVLERSGQLLDAMDRMQRYRGHFYNWYDTRTLEALRPLYVSTVDSGNLAGHLLTFVAGLGNLASTPVFRREVFAGLGDTVDLAIESVTASAKNPSTRPEGFLNRLTGLRSAVVEPPSVNAASWKILRRLAATAAEIQGLVSARNDAELKWWLGAFERQCAEAMQEIGSLGPWLDFAPPDEKTLRETPGLQELMDRLARGISLGETARLASECEPIFSPSVAQGDQSWLKNLRGGIQAASEAAAQRLRLASRLMERSIEFADVDYEFLYDKERRLLAIGYNAAEHHRDVSFYDLLASEARLASFIAIAQGKLPQEHWFALGRLLTRTGTKPSLVSWSGSMFEYLMPLLVMPSYPGSLLDETYRASVARQIEYGKSRGVPWGISESGYNKTDAQLNYQYRAFGVPGLGFKRGLADDLVVAPYATAMALMVEPEFACANLQRMAKEDLVGVFGFYEAIDYTPSRLPPGQDNVPIRSFMAHHQGMALLSIAHVLLDQPMQKRFASEPAFRATDLLLQERVPKSPPIYPHRVTPAETRGVRGEPDAKLIVFDTPHTYAPAVHLLSNGRYHVAVTAAGGGYSRWRDLALTRWHEDPTRDCWGMFCYIRDVESGVFWSASHHPTLKAADRYEAIFSEGRAEFRRSDDGLETHEEIAVSPEDDIELRRVSITNRSGRSRTIEVTSYAEVVLAPPAADASHPAFSNLFVQTRIVPRMDGVLCSRRPRSSGERPPWMMHLMTVDGGVVGEASYETSRAEFIGRGRTIADPAAMHRDTLSNSEGSVLDPILAIRRTVLIEPDQVFCVHFVSGITETQEQTMGLMEKYHDRHLADRVFELAWTHSQVVMRQLDVTDSDTRLYGMLTGSILYSHARMRAPASVVAGNRRGQPGLWGYGISGDLPIVLLRIGDVSRLAIVRQLVHAHAYWRMKGLPVDLVIWNEDLSSYRQLLHEQITGMVGSGSEANLIDKPGGIFVRRLDQMPDEDKVLMQTVARIVLSDSAGTLQEQLVRRTREPVPLPRFMPTRPRRTETQPPSNQPPRQLAEFNGHGGFTHDGREYVITTTERSPTPAPWVNVLANPWFGSVVSETGASYTWCENAQMYRLTPWHNDPISDVGGEAFYLRDEETGEFWSPTPGPARGVWPYTTRHGFGYSIFETRQAGITTETCIYVATDAPVKFIVIKVRNDSGRPRRIGVTGVMELVLGARRAANMPNIVTEVDAKTGCLLARNPYNPEFQERCAFMDVSEPQRWVSGDRTEILGRNGSPANPACMGRTRLSGRTGATLDPCFAMQTTIDLAEGEERQVVFTFGSGRDQADASKLAGRFRSVVAARSALEAVWEYWNRTLGAVNIQTPDPSINFLANGWLLYQTLACRVWGRSGFYQSGGAYGFRDQLQDTMALIHAEPAILREQLLRSAARQFPEGDVQHWWHPPLGRGVRTHISDDYLWLPYAACRYVAAIGDTGVLDENVRFIEGRPVSPTEESYYDLPAQSETSATLYEHCLRAIRHGLRFGEHGLPLMGCGDWNDGMNLVGEHGKGESVWLAFFLHDVLSEFAKLASARGDRATVQMCHDEAAKLRANIERNAWDGAWYRRAYFDNGEPLGSAASAECQIDSLPQSWAVLSGVGSSERKAAGLASLDTRLVKRDIGVIQLFNPPFDNSPMNPGYIKGYVPGVRENGGQYTHAAIWAVMAFAAAGDAEKAWELFRLINPVRHGDSPAAIEKYKVEPYVVAADIYTNPQHMGRGGWTWYTGSAGWMYRLITESLLGIRLEVNKLHIAPLLPSDWESFDVHYRYRNTVHHIHVRRTGPGNGVDRVTLDGVDQPEKTISLAEDHADHHTEVLIGNEGVAINTSEAVEAPVAQNR
jgi:cyclic beta-1,2-glucan synthetase